MNKSIYLLTILLAINTSLAFTQQAKISGRIITVTNQPVEYANVRLLTADSIFITGTASDKSGKFSLEAVPSKNYRLLISALGYEPLQITIKDIREKSSLGELVLTESSVALDEVTVSANRVIQKIDRQINYPSRIALESSNNALDLLKKMTLPRVIVNTLKKEVSLVGNESVKLRINGIDADPNQVAALLAEDIIRIDYYDNPGVRVRESAIIDFIVKKRESGGYVAADLSNAPYMSFGNDMVSTRFNHKNSEWSLFYNASYGRFKKSYVESTTEYNFPEETIRQQSVGIPSLFKNQTHVLNLGYNYTIPDKRVINVQLSGFLQDYLKNDRSANTYSNLPEMQFLSRAETKDKIGNPTLDIYYKEELTKSQTLFLNLVTGYIPTDHLYEYQEEYTPNHPEYSFENHISGNKYSVIGEAAHQVKWNKLILYSGVNYKLGYTRNNYEGDVDEKVSIDNNDLYIYSQLQGQAGKFSFNAGLGVAYSSFSNQSKRFHFWTFRPSLSLAYSLGNNFSLRYKFNVIQDNPSLYDLNDVLQNSNQYVASVGNLELKPYVIYHNGLQLNYQGKRFQCYLGVLYRYFSNLITGETTFDETLSKFVVKTINQKRYQNFSPIAGFTWEIVENMLSFSLDGQILWTDSRGDNYNYRYTSYNTGGRIDFNLKQWRAGIGMRSRFNMLMGENINYGELGSTAEVGYKHKELYLGVSVYNFLPDKRTSGTKNLSRLTPGTSWSYLDDNHPVCCINLSWNFSWGKQSGAEQKQLQNRDTGGVVGTR